MSTVPADVFYDQYHGHSPKLLQRLLEVIRGRRNAIIYLAGDSSLDNKYWLESWKKAVNGYEEVLTPPTMKADVCYWLNCGLVERRQPFCALNTAVEATTLGQRVGGWFGYSLLSQDEFIRDNLTPNDYIVVSIGGNDIALAPTFSTIVSILMLVYGASEEAIVRGDAWGLGHFISMFRDQLSQYLKMLVERQKPRKVLVCMIYHPDVRGEGSWADSSLSALDYNRHPQRLQAAIAAVFEHAVCQIRIEGTEVVPVPLFQVLNGSDTLDYVERVEPSEQGGRKMAEALLERILANPR